MLRDLTEQNQFSSFKRLTSQMGRVPTKLGRNPPSSPPLATLVMKLTPTSRDDRAKSFQWSPPEKKRLGQLRKRLSKLKKMGRHQSPEAEVKEEKGRRAGGGEADAETEGLGEPQRCFCALEEVSHIYLRI
jgi:hypothetical protein